MSNEPPPITRLTLYEIASHARGNLYNARSDIQEAARLMINVIEMTPSMIDDPTRAAFCAMLTSIVTLMNHRFDEIDDNFERLATMISTSASSDFEDATAEDLDRAACLLATKAMEKLRADRS